LEGFIMHKAVHRMNVVSPGCTAKLGCDKEDLRIHIEALMSPAMLWSDYGELWEIDHIVPFCQPVNGARPTLEDKFERMHYSNLQPIWIWAHKLKTAGEISEWAQSR
jgi:hypothetical protein